MGAMFVQNDMKKKKNECKACNERRDIVKNKMVQRLG